MHVHERPAMHLPEPRRIERRRGLANRRPDPRIAVTTHDARVLVARLEEIDLLDRDQPDRIADAGPDPRQVLRRWRAKSRGELLEHFGELGWRRGCGALQACERRAQ